MNFYCIGLLRISVYISGYINTLNPEELIPIMEKLENRNDKRSLCQVSKEFLRARCITLRRFRSLVPSLLEVVLPASPNLLRFCSPIPLQNSHLKLLAQSCPKLEELWLDREIDLVPQPVDVDFDDNGVSELAVCNNLEDVDFSGRINVGDFGVVSLVRSCLNLQSLTLEGCLRITDEALKSIAELTKLNILNLKNCSLITNIGLKYLANGETKNCLNDLVLANCGTNITDVGIVSLSEIRFLSLLDTSMLANVSDASLVEISSKCTKMRQLYLNGCVAITGNGLRAFTKYGNISELRLVNCPNISWEDVVSIGCTFEMLESLHLDRRMQNPMPAAGLEQDFEFGGRNHVKIRWE